MINNLAKQVHANAIEKGFYEDGKAQNMGERIALIHSELSEALEADRKGAYCEVPGNHLNDWENTEEFIKFYKDHVKGSFEEEMADVVIRIMDMCEHKKINLEEHIIAKMRYNKSREKYHGKKY